MRISYYLIQAYMTLFYNIIFALSRKGKYVHGLVNV